MAHTVKRIARGPSTKVNSYAGPAGELVMDTTTNDLVLETGVQGGVRMAKASTAIAAANGVSVTAGGTLGEATTISGVDATTSAKGVVQLSDATTGTSQTKAATEKAVSDALQAAKDYADQAAAGGGNYTGTAPIAVDQSTHVVSIDDASTTGKGAVQLSSLTTGLSETKAATEKAVADALTAAKAYADTAGNYTGTAPIAVDQSTHVISAADATTSAKGVVQVGDNVTVSSGTISVKPWATYAASSASVDASTLQDGALVQTGEAIGAPTAVLAPIEQELSGSAASVPSSYAVQKGSAHLAMPSGQYENLTLPAYGGTVTAPADGYIRFHGQATGTGGGFGLFCDATQMSMFVIVPSATQTFDVFIPVSKSDVVAVYYGGGTNREIVFIYANGSIPA